MHRELPILSAFTGLGGLDLGLECAGFTTVGCIEHDATARASLKKNRPAWTLLDACDAATAHAEISPADFGLRKRQLAMLVGGPPCQPFSKAAQWSPQAMKGVNDDRSKCLDGFLALVGVFLPRVLLIENVQGFVTGKTSAISKVTKALAKINRDHRVSYKLQSWVVDAADYGVPQHRRRAILFAERSGLQLQLPAPTHHAQRATAWDAIGHLPRQSTSDLSTAREAGWLELLPTIPEGCNYQWHTRRGGGEPLFSYRSRFWSFLLKLARTQAAWTIPAQPGPYTGPFHWDNRPLTVVELLRLQSFPASWIVSGSRNQQVRQIGNATPPLFAEHLGRWIRCEVFGEGCTRPLQLAIASSGRKPPKPAPPSPLPARFRDLIRQWPDHPGAGRGPRPVRAVTTDG